MTRERSASSLAGERQAELLASTGRLAGGIAHDFNNHLTAILGYAELLEMQLQRRGDASGELKDVREIQRAAERGRELTQRLLSFAGRLPSSPRIIDVNQLLSGMERLLRQMLPSSIELTLDFAGAAVLVIVEPTGFEQLILSLAVNGQDAMRAGGKLRVATRLYDLAQNGFPPGTVIGAPTIIDGEYVEIAVHDTGVGIPEEFVRRAFEPYVTTHPDDANSGNGLGLSVVYGLATRSNGVVVVEATANVGTTVRVLFPRVTVDDDESQKPTVLK